jgi:hypothetical protein
MTIVLHNKNEQFVSLMTLFRCSQIILPSLTSGLFPLNDQFSTYCRSSMINPFSSSYHFVHFPIFKPCFGSPILFAIPFPISISFSSLSYSFIGILSSLFMVQGLLIMIVLFNFIYCNMFLVYCS